MKPQLPSRVPATIDRLLALLAAADSLEGVQVLDGPALSMDQVEDDTICVAPGTPDAPGAFSTMAPQNGMGRAAYVEQVEVVVTIQSYGGDVEAKPRRDRVGELLAAVKGVIDEHQVDEAWDNAMLGPEISWHFMVDERGATCAAGFTLVFRSVI